MPIFNGTSGNETINGTQFSDYISAYEGNDLIRGLAGDDTIYAGDGDDIVEDGAGADRLFGQNGADFFSMDIGIGNDFVDGGRGLDVVRYEDIADAMPGIVTVVDFLYSSSNSGLAAGDTLVSIEGFEGGRGRDIVLGSDDLNIFYGSLGNDQYFGRGGTDIYRAWIPTDPGDRLSFEVAFGARAATLAANAGLAAPAAGRAVAYYDIWNDLNLNDIRDAGEVTRQADILDSIDYFVGTGGADRMTGTAGDETFAPLTGADIVNGGSGYDFLSYEFLGPLPVYGGIGVIVDLAAATAITFIGSLVPATAQVLGIEGVIGSRFSDQLQGNAVANRMAGGDGNDAIDGRAGADELYGGAGNDIVVGGDGNDIISGGAGRDTLDGGAGIDVVSYASAETPITVSLLVGSGLTTGAATDSLGDVLLNVENVVGSTFVDNIVGDDSANVLEGRAGSDELFGCGGDDIIYGESDPRARIPDFLRQPDFTDGNILNDCDCDQEEGEDAVPLYDDKINGGDGADRLFGQLGDDEVRGGNGNDYLSGGEGDDILDGQAGDDSLDGGLGTDFLYGGEGNDRISGGAGFDIIFGGAGRDTVDYSASAAGVTVNLGEFWRNSGGDASSDLLTEIMLNLADGEDPAIILQSAIFFSLLTVIGSSGTDGAFTLGVPDVILGVESVVGSEFADTLIGDALANSLFGGGGADLLDGGAGNDTMSGGNGNDLYRVDSAGDRAVEASAAGGIDTVESSANFVLGVNVENLVLLDGALTGTGSAGANRITGNAAANTLNGGAGADRLTGLDGNDIYFVDNAGDVVVESDATGGIDTVRSTVSYTLGANVETLTLIGTAAIDGSGNSLANTLTGNAAANRLSGLGGNDRLAGGVGNDTLSGGTGLDTLTGGAGLDLFRFDAALSALTNVDSITDFSVADDTIVLAQAIFTGLAAGALPATRFQLGTAANDSVDRIIYDQATGRIFYDADGNGGGASILFARVTAGLALTSADFTVSTTAAEPAAVKLETWANHPLDDFSGDYTRFDLRSLGGDELIA